MSLFIGQKIKHLRQEQGLSLGELSRLAGLSKGYLSHIESGNSRRPSAETLAEIGRALGTSVPELLGGAVLLVLRRSQASRSLCVGLPRRRGFQ